LDATQLEHRIVWTACPNGLAAGGNLNLSVCVAHQLGSRGFPPASGASAKPLPLRRFPLALAWDQQVVSFSVVFHDDAGNPVATVGSANGSVTVLNTAVNHDIWTGVFDAHTPVQPFYFEDQSSQPVVSYAADYIFSQVRAMLGALIGDGLVKQPAAATVLQPEGFGPLVVTPDQRLLVEARIRARQRGTAGREFLTLSPFEPQQAYFQEAYQFHARPQGAATLADDRKTQPWTYDFHNAVAALSHLPAIARLVGLIFDLQIELPKTLRLPARGLVSVVPVLKGPRPGLEGRPPYSVLENLTVCPATAYQYTAPLRSSAPSSQLPHPAGFLARQDPHRPAPQGGDLDQGMLTLGNANLFARIDMDIDGWVHKCVSFARALQEQKQNGVQGAQAGALPPSARSAGISICRAWREKAVTQMLVSANAANALVKRLASSAAIETRIPGIGSSTGTNEAA